jgi:Uma2 family endonuclease
MATTPKVLTYEEWLQMPVVEDGIEEVVDGEVRIMPPNKIFHADVIEELAEIVRSQIDRKLVRVIISVFGLVIRRDPLTTRVPDLAVFVKVNIVLIDGYIHSAPELVVEVLSPRNTRGQRAEKIRDYESIGVPELWVLSPEAQTVEIMQLSAGGKLETVAIVNQGQIRPKLFPQVSVDVASIWPR